MSKSETENAVREAVASWLRAFNAKDLDGIISHYDPEAVYASDASPLMLGPDKIRAWFEPILENLTATSLFQEEAMLAGTDMALVIGKFYFRPADDSDDEEPGETGRVGLGFRQAADGRWLLLFDMDNRPPDVTPKDFD